MALFFAKNSEDSSSTSEVISGNAWPSLIWPTLCITARSLFVDTLRLLGQ